MDGIASAEPDKISGSLRCRLYALKQQKIEEEGERKEGELLKPIYLVGSKGEWAEGRAQEHVKGSTGHLYPKKVTTVENVDTKTILGT